MRQLPRTDATRGKRSRTTVDIARQTPDKSPRPLICRIVQRGVRRVVWSRRSPAKTGTSPVRRGTDRYLSPCRDVEHRTVADPLEIHTHEIAAGDPSLR